MRILALAYACEPGKGSEPGAGWAWARMLAHLGDTWVITRENNRAAIEAELATVPERDRLRFIYVDLPPWARTWKRGLRGMRLYYALWQVAAFLRAKRLNHAIRFDAIWHLTLANAWIGSLGGLVGPTFIYGPVGGGVKAPRSLLATLGGKGIAYEALRDLVRFLGRYTNPMASLAWQRASLILVQNEETRRWLPSRHRSKAEVFPNVVLEGLPVAGRSDPRDGGQTAFFAGRLLAWKGVSLAIHAMRHLPGWRLVIIGSGPDEARLRHLASRWGLAGRVEFVRPLPREELLRWMAEEADVFLFPSLHDEAGWVVAEAAASGLPVICLDVGGPPLLGGSTIAPSTPAKTASELAEATMNAAVRGDVASSGWELNARLEALTTLLRSRMAKEFLPGHPDPRRRVRSAM